MTCSTSFFSKPVRLLIICFIVLLSGCGSPTGHIRNVSSLSVDLESEPQDKETSGPLFSGRDILVACLPPENLSSTKAPLKEIAASMRASLRNKGFRPLEVELLEIFRKKYRMRYTGGISSKLSESLRQELGVDAILITSLEAYKESDPPQISLISRLVTSGREPEIVWIDSVGLSGDQSPGLLDLTRIRSIKRLQQKAIEKLTSSLDEHFYRLNRGDEPRAGSSYYRLRNKYLPYDYFRSPNIQPGRKPSIAVIPMLDLAVRKNAGRIVSLHYVRELFQLTDFKVIEPGLVREELLRIRAIMPQGPSLAVTDLITGERSLSADFVLTGKVFDYQNSSRNPKVDFSLQIIEKNSREVVFGARTFSVGMDGVFFFDLGRVFTAHNLLEELAGTTVLLLVKPPENPSYEPSPPVEGDHRDDYYLSRHLSAPESSEGIITFDNHYNVIYWH